MIHPWVIAGDGLIYRDKVIKISKLDTDDNLLHFSTSHEFTYNNLAGSIYLAPFENIKLYKKFITDIICVAPEYGKKIFNSILNKNIKCGNIFLHLEDKKILIIKLHYLRIRIFLIFLNASSIMNLKKMLLNQLKK